MISICDDCEFTVLIADLIATLSIMEKDNEHYELQILASNRDIPVLTDDNADIHFLQEGVRIDDKETILYLWYDSIECFNVVRK